MGITAKMDIDEVLSGLDDLIDRLSQIPDSETTQIQVDGIDDVEAAANEAEVSLEQVQEAAGMVGTDLSSIDTSSLQSVSDAASNAANDMSSVSTSASGVDLSLESIGAAASHASNGISNIAEGMSQTKNETKNAANATSILAEGFGVVEGVVGGLVSIALAAWIDQIANAAGNFQDSWLRLTLSMGDTTDEVGVMKDQWNSAITEMHETTGRRAGSIREFITQMGISGVKSSEVITQAFDAIAGSDFILTGGKNLEGIASAFENVIRQPTRVVGALRTMGITTDDIMKSTGLSTEELTAKFKTMTVEQRAVFLSNILNAKYGQEANEGYKLSWEHVKEALGAAWDYMSRILGSLILPLIVPVLEFLTDLLGQVAGAIDSLNPVFKSISGVIILVGGALASVAGLWVGFQGILNALGPVMGALGLETLGLGGAFGTLAGILSGPVGWAILAIIAAVTTALYIWQNWNAEITALYNNLMNGDWGAAINQIANAFGYIGTAIWNTLVSIGQQVYTFFQNLPAMIGNAESAWLDFGMKIMDWIINGLISASQALATIMVNMTDTMATNGASGGFTAGQDTGNAVIDGLMKWLEDNWPKIQELLTKLFTQLLPLLIQVIVMIMAIVAKTLFDLAVQAGSNLVMGFVSWLTQLPGIVGGILLGTFMGLFYYWAYVVPQIATQTAMLLLSNFISWLSQLPGRAWAIFLQFLGYLGSLPGRAGSYASSVGSSIVNNIGSYLSSLPGRMYSWGMQALQRFVDGIINTIPGLRAALNAVSSLFPHSPPKEGPLATITESNMYSWMKGIMNAGMAAANEFDLDSIMFPNITSGKVSTNSKQQVEVKVVEEHNINFNGVPDGVDTANMDSMFRDWLESREGKSVLDRVYGEIFNEFKRSNGG